MQANLSCSNSLTVNDFLKRIGNLFCSSLLAGFLGTNSSCSSHEKKAFMQDVIVFCVDGFLPLEYSYINILKSFIVIVAIGLFK